MSYDLFVLFQCVLSNVNVEMELSVRFANEKGKGNMLIPDQFIGPLTKHGSFESFQFVVTGNFPFKTSECCSGRALQSKCQFENDILVTVLK